MYNLLNLPVKILYRGYRACNGKKGNVKTPKSQKTPIDAIQHINPPKPQKPIVSSTDPDAMSSI